MATDIAPQINLTLEEQSVFALILDIDREMNLGQQYRVAGGWVRDRLLGFKSDDIDIALDRMTGSEFLKNVRAYQLRYPDAPIQKSYVVNQNPDRSKHLETTALELGPFKIDFVNLRSESYTSGSRVPEMTFGDPKSDAERRDLTINALFYNLKTERVEDFVAGLGDLRTMTLATPMDARQTFMDDPLRILRALRFYSCYSGSQLTPEILSAMSDPAVQEGYRVKVAPERAGPELVKLFRGASPGLALRALYRTGMDSALFSQPRFQELNSFEMSQRNPNHQFVLSEHTFKVLDNYQEILVKMGVSDKNRGLALMAAWFHDFGKMDPSVQKPKGQDLEKGIAGNVEHMTYVGHEHISAELSDLFLRQIGIPQDDREFVNTIVREHMFPHSHQTQHFSKRMMGRFLRNTTLPGQERLDIWKFVTWHGQADAGAKGPNSRWEDQMEYEVRFCDMEEYLSSPPPIKPLVDGTRIMEMFPTLSPGSGFIKEIHSRLVDEQSSGTIGDRDAADRFVEQMRLEIEQAFGQ